MAQSYTIQLRWLSVEQGGRKNPIGGGRYTPTARFAGEQEHFSVVLEYPKGVCNPSTAILHLLNPDLVEIQLQIHPGVALEIMEGANVVAHCTVLSIADEAVVSART
jgi:hypothetical protein